LELAESGRKSTGMVEVYTEFSKSAINVAGKLGKQSLTSVLGHKPFFAGNGADVHCIIKAEVLNEYTKMRGRVNETITTCPGTAV
jgi:hypothetical protein